MEQQQESDSWHRPSGRVIDHVPGDGRMMWSGWDCGRSRGSDLDLVGEWRLIYASEGSASYATVNRRDRSASTRPVRKGSQVEPEEYSA